MTATNRRASMRFTFALAACLAAGGCATTVPVTAPPTGDAAFELNYRGGNGSSLIETTGGRTEAARRLAVDENGVVFRSSDGSERTLLLSEVRRIQFRSDWGGARDGVLFGLGVSAILGLLSAIEEPDDYLIDSRGEAFALVTLLTAVVTVPVGALIGAIFGHKTNYDFPVR